MERISHLPPGDITVSLALVARRAYRALLPVLHDTRPYAGARN